MGEIMPGGDILSNLLKEADAYTNFDQMEKLVEDGVNLGAFPIQPLYVVIKTLPPQKVATLLEKLTSEQRGLLMDLDLWHKDDVDVSSFQFWIDSYSHCSNETIRTEFVGSCEFAMYLKARFNIHTFDVEEPVYPDHDCFFLTDDNLLLFEFDEDYQYVHEVRNLIRELYGERGVENAYSYLFKLTVDSFLILQEDEYQQKKERLRDCGFVDYYDALELENAFLGIEVMDKYIQDKVSVTGEIDDHAKLQVLHKSALAHYTKGIDLLQGHLAKIKSEKRAAFLKFNFIQLINSSLTLYGALKEGRVAISRIGDKTRAQLLLGLSYVIEKAQLEADESVFDRFEFWDIHKIGNTLIKLAQKPIKKALAESGFDNETEIFLGNYWVNFLEDSFDVPVKFKQIHKGKQKEKVPEKKTSLPIVDIETYRSWESQSKTLISLIPFIKQFYDTFLDLKTSGKLRDEFYLNYAVAEIDFEAIILSTFANFAIGMYEDPTVHKMGLTIDEFQQFVSLIILAGKIDRSPDSKVNKLVSEFISKFGMDKIEGIDDYTIELLCHQLEGYDYENLSPVDFKHVGGPILLVSGMDAL